MRKVRELACANPTKPMMAASCFRGTPAVVEKVAEFMPPWYGLARVFAIRQIDNN